jgi:electron transfer flavoprotein alpha/beta subunit
LAVLSTLPSLPLPTQPLDGEDALLDVAEPLDGARVLVIGHGALEAICGLIRRGCTAATEMQPHCRLSPDPESVDAVLVPHVGSLTEAQEAVALAGRALIMGGRIALCDATGRLRPMLAALLGAHGFVGMRAVDVPHGTVLTAERPIFGPLHRR